MGKASSQRKPRISEKIALKEAIGKFPICALGGSSVQCHPCLLPDVNRLGEADTISCAWTLVGAGLPGFLGVPRGGLAMTAGGTL